MQRKDDKRRLMSGEDPGPILLVPFPPLASTALDMGIDSFLYFVEENAGCALPKNQEQLLTAICNWFERASWPDFTPLDQLPSFLPEWIHFPARLNRKAWMRVVQALQKEGYAQAYLRGYQTVTVCSGAVDVSALPDRDGIPITNEELDAYFQAPSFEAWRNDVRARNYRDRHTPLW